MATVFLARLGGAGGFQRLVAIKRLHPHLAKDADFVQMFLDEARLAARLHHPHVVPILEIGESEGYYLVMEYVEGDTLARLLARSAQAARPLPTKVSVRIALDTLAGLHAAHELVDDDGRPLEIVHRDVSPQNVLIGVDGSSKIADFGVARAASRLTTTRSGQLKGKLSYMAPEQARGKPLDRRADIFAMGIVLWEMLAQKRLFKGEGEADTLERVLNAEIPHLEKVAPHVPKPLADVAMKALDRDVDARFATAAEFGDALEQAARSVDLLGSPKDVAEQLQAVIGTDISQQREAVRAWLARSEPSRSGASRPSAPPPSASKPGIADSATKIEAGRATREVPRDPTVSSVSSAAISVGKSSAPGPIAPGLEEERPRRAGVWIGAAALVVAAAAVILLVVRGKGTEAPRGGAAVPPPVETHVEVPTAAPLEIAASALPVASAAPPPQDSASSAPIASSAPSSRPSGKSRGGARGGHRTTSPTTTVPSATTGLPDDMSKNPYR